MVQNFDTHKFLFTLKHDDEIVGHEVEFLDRDNKLFKIVLKDIEVGLSPVSCKLFDEQGNRYLVPFIRIRRVFRQGELVWDNSSNDLSNVKVIKGYK